MTAGDATYFKRRRKKREKGSSSSAEQNNNHNNNLFELFVFIHYKYIYIWIYFFPVLWTVAGSQCYISFRYAHSNSIFLQMILHLKIWWGFPGSSAGKEFTCNAGDPSSIPGREDPCRRDRLPTPVFLGLPGGSAGKESTCNVGDLGLILGLGRSPGEGKGYPLPVFWPGEFHGLYRTWGCQESDMTEQLSLKMW